MKEIPLILFSIILNTIAQLALKAGMARIGYFSFSWNNFSGIALQVISNPFILIGFSCYVFSVFVWLLVLSRTAVSVAYPLASLGYIATAMAAYFLFGEHLTVMRILGIMTIMLGVYLVARA